MDWTKIYKKYKGMWVAIKDDHVSVIASAQTLKEVIEKSKLKGYNNPIFTRVPNELIAFAGAN